MWYGVSTGNENYTGIAARDTANALAVLAHAVRGVAAGTNNTQTQGYILSTAQQASLPPPSILSTPYQLILQFAVTMGTFKSYDLVVVGKWASGSALCVY